MASALSAMERQVSNLNVGNLTLKELNQKLMQKAIWAPHESTSKKLDRLFTTTPTGVLEIYLTVDQRLVSCFAREVGELCYDRDALTWNWHN